MRFFFYYYYYTFHLVYGQPSFVHRRTVVTQVGQCVKENQCHTTLLQSTCLRNRICVDLCNQYRCDWLLTVHKGPRYLHLDSHQKHQEQQRWTVLYLQCKIVTRDLSSWAYTVELTFKQIRSHITEATGNHRTMWPASALVPNIHHHTM